MENLIQRKPKLFTISLSLIAVLIFALTFFGTKSLAAITKTCYTSTGTNYCTLDAQPTDQDGVIFKHATTYEIKKNSSSSFTFVDGTFNGYYYSSRTTPYYAYVWVEDNNEEVVSDSVQGKYLEDRDYYYDSLGITLEAGSGGYPRGNVYIMNNISAWSSAAARTDTVMYIK